ncbi:hypothetical protein [Stenotrophomonas maltophilia]
MIIAGSAAGLDAGAAAVQLVDRLQDALGGSTSPARPAPAAHLVSAIGDAACGGQHRVQLHRGRVVLDSVAL